MQHGHLIGLLPHGVAAKHFREQVMVAIAVARIVERNDEQVASLEALQQRLRARLAGDRVAQRTIQSIEDGGAEQESTDGVGLREEHFLDEVVGDVAIVAREGPNELLHVAMMLERQRRQLEARDPAFRARLQRGHVCGREVERHHLVEECGHFVRREPDIRSSKLRHLSARAQSSEGKAWLGPARDDHVHALRQMIQQERQAAVYRRRIDDVEVVEDEDDVAIVGTHLIDERRERRFVRRLLQRAQHGEGVVAESGLDLLERADDVGPEEGGVVLAAIERHPPHRRLTLGALGQPLGEQCGLAESCRCRDERELALGAGADALDEPHAGHEAGAPAWLVEFGLEDGERQHDAGRRPAWRGGGFPLRRHAGIVRVHTGNSNGARGSHDGHPQLRESEWNGLDSRCRIGNVA